jgi:hypothetical protein
MGWHQAHCNCQYPNPPNAQGLLNNFLLLTRLLLGCCQNLSPG